MRMTTNTRAAVAAFAGAIACELADAGPAAAQIDRGYQTINGTRVYTEVDHQRRVATFSNACGSQTLTQAQLQAGAIPTRIIPCPRPQRAAPPQYNAPPRYTSPTPGYAPPARTTLWGATAAGIDEGSTNRVGVGIAWKYPSEGEARDAAMNQCRARAYNCSVVGTWTGCGFVTSGKDDNGRVGWGSGGTAQEAYNECAKHGLYCDQPIGGCNN